ncbi:protein containing adenylation domain of kDNA-like ligase [Pseudomonas phage EM]|uniref:DNA ligase n=1 Tax=Pseudomonas phage EM TaxID=2936914 RepID=A0AAE9KU57_9CAUD|nr:protein containing adenylation domain of kDNA-like ligase [Pseudomonas phage EM]UPW35841.1 protein containing adenylation domain of kDNA-like ligase [Pseudomonas phage EM]
MSYHQRLYGLDKKGTYKEWNISVLPCADMEGQYVIEVTYGKEGGAMTPQYTVIKAGKQGRSVYEQAVSEARSKVSKQHDKGYRETKEELNDLPVMAMLAKAMDPAKYKAGYGSPKLDGVRCMAKMENGEVTLTSRMGKPYNVPHIIKELQASMKEGEVWDGELYVHGEVLEDINSAVKREDAYDKWMKAEKALDAFTFANESDNAEYDKLCKAVDDASYIHGLRQRMQFHVFDIVKDGLTFKERLVEFQFKAETYVGRDIQFVEYVFCETFDDLKKLHDVYRQAGYEGIMWRSPEGLYESGKRSNGLQKYKEFFDMEMEIVDYVEDKNGNAVLVVFDPVPQERLEVGYGDFDARKDQIANFDKYKGKWLTVQIQSRFKKTLRAQFPTGKMIRAGRVIGGVFIPEE